MYNSYDRVKVWCGGRMYLLTPEVTDLKLILSAGKWALMQEVRGSAGKEWRSVPTSDEVRVLPAVGEDANRQTVYLGDILAHATKVYEDGIAYLPAGIRLEIEEVWYNNGSCCHSYTPQGLSWSEYVVVGNVLEGRELFALDGREYEDDLDDDFGGKFEVNAGNLRRLLEEDVPSRRA